MPGTSRASARPVSLSTGDAGTASALASGTYKGSGVDYRDVDRLHRKITAAGHLQSEQHRCGDQSKVFCARDPLAEASDNPFRGVEQKNEDHQRRYLSADELARLTKALAEHSNNRGPTSSGSSC